MSRFYGTDLTWGLSDLKAYVQRNMIASASPEIADPAGRLPSPGNTYGSLKLSSDGRSSIVC